MSRDALLKACDDAGGQSALAERIGVRQSTFWHWLRKSKRGIPGEYVLKVERITGISRHDLRPDLYPRDPEKGAAA